MRLLTAGVLLGCCSVFGGINEQAAEWKRCASFEEVVFAVRSLIPDGHWYANFGYYCDGPARVAYGKEGRLLALNIRNGAVRTLVDDTEGAVRDPVVSYDGKKVLFSYRKGGTEHYNLYEINADGSELEQITDGDGKYDDIEPCYLPDGDIVFVSSRNKRWVQCWLTQVAGIFRCRPDGTGVRQLSANVEHDNTPWILPDGRIVYMRWEYVDRSQVHYHHLWTMNQDGTGHQVYFGNLNPGGVFIDAKPIPGTDDLTLIDSPGHGSREHAGFLARVSPKRGPDEKDALVRISKGHGYRDPWAFGTNLFMAAFGKQIRLVNSVGEVYELYNYSGDAKDQIWVHEPRPLMPRNREPLMPDRTDRTKTTGVFVLENVYEGRQMADVKRGTIKKLLILESLPKPINYTGGMDPLSYKGTFTLPRVWGTVPVEADGSAHFEAPALKALFFIALDENGRAVKRMQSFTQVMPGEVLGCVGCHENRTLAPRGYTTGTILALRRPPSVICSKGLAFDVPDFPKYVQPVLDRYCVKCHNGDKRAGGIDLSGDRGVMFSMGYYSLVAWNQVRDGRNYPKSNYAPYELGSGGSPLMNKIDGSHKGVKLAPADAGVIRLWLDASAPYPGTYAALGCGSIGGYAANEQRLNSDRDWAVSLKSTQVMVKRCMKCHTDKQNPLPHKLHHEAGLSFWNPDMQDRRLRHSRHALFNLTNPEKSLYLRAPLAKGAGGLGLCSESVYKSTDDPGYQTMLRMIEAGRNKLNEVKRFDMRGFRPTPEYFREMKRYGVLPADFNEEKDPIDVYQTDRCYWNLFDYKPERSQK